MIDPSQYIYNSPSPSPYPIVRLPPPPAHFFAFQNITYTGLQSTAFVSESRQIVAESTGARITGKAACDVVLFGGNGVTGVVGLLIDILNLRGLAAAANGKGRRRPVVFVGPHEHHSNLLPWRESGCEMILIPERVEA